MKRVVFAAIFSVIGLAALTGCGETEFTVNVTVMNRTDLTITEVNFAHESDDSNHENIIAEDFPPNATLTYNLGNYTEEALAEGFSLRAVSAADYIDESFGHLILKDGDKITLYEDEDGLALAINASDEEIEKMVKKEETTAPASNDAIH